MAAKPLLAELLRERFTSPWWVSPDGPDVDNELNCGTRRQALSDALHGYDNDSEDDNK